VCHKSRIRILITTAATIGSSLKLLATVGFSASDSVARSLSRTSNPESA
jgi:hypothetical protein